MEKRKLGKYGAEVSPIGVGAMSFSNFYGPTNEKESHKILTEALDQDISHIDTANVYGCLLYTSPSPRDPIGSRMPSSA